MERNFYSKNIIECIKNIFKLVNPDILISEIDLYTDLKLLDDSNILDIIVYVNEDYNSENYELKELFSRYVGNIVNVDMNNLDEESLKYISIDIYKECIMKFENDE